mmetsp:Transcript_55817/g.110205  ORF Transcript_55817/g.110205 Transcript_55817/m.110205 type:complete len:91 (-) Transcript_55817:838-1110(-)
MLPVRFYHLDEPFVGESTFMKGSYNGFGLGELCIHYYVRLCVQKQAFHGAGSSLLLCSRDEDSKRLMSSQNTRVIWQHLGRCPTKGTLAT